MSATTSDASSITVVLVHGAFADSSSWNGVIERLQDAGVRVTAPANPAPRDRPRLRVPRELSRADPGAGRCGRATRTVAR